jgi:hypothetical protein
MELRLCASKKDRQKEAICSYALPKKDCEEERQVFWISGG